MEIYKFSKLTQRNEITNLKPGLRDKDRVNVFIGGEFKFSLDITQVVDYKLKVGKLLTSEEISELKKASTFGKLYTSTLEWVLVRPRSIRETYDYLKRKRIKREQTNVQREKNKEYLKNNPEMRLRARELKIFTAKLENFTEEDAEKVVEKLVEKKYLDDERFAKFYVENKNVKKGVSERKLREDLKKKGIATEIISRVLENSERTPEEEIKKIIARKKRKYTAKDRMISYIVRQGFPYGEVKDLVEEEFSKKDDLFA